MMRAGLSDLSAFLAIAEHGSFRAAAKVLEVTPSALSHTLRGFEAKLGVRLFNRTTRSVALTEAGQQLLARVRGPMAELAQAMDDTVEARERPSGHLRISATELGASLLVRHVLPAFLDTYPDIHVEFIVDGRMVDIVAEGLDAGVRLLEDVPQDMVAARFGPEFRMCAVASPGYLAQHGTPSTPQELLKHRCIRFRFESGSVYRWDLVSRGKTATLDVQGPMTLGNTHLMIHAACSGIGIAWVPHMQIESQLASGTLVHLLPEWSPVYAGLCLYYPANRHPPTALRLFAQAVRAWGQAQSGSA